MAYSLWERAYEAQFDHQTAEWIKQLNEYQLLATKMLEAGQLLDHLLEVMIGLKTRSICGSRIMN